MNGMRSNETTGRCVFAQLEPRLLLDAHPGMSALLGDLNVDGVRDASDLGILQDAIEQQLWHSGFLASADLDRDGLLGVGDLNILQSLVEGELTETTWAPPGNVGASSQGDNEVAPLYSARNAGWDGPGQGDYALQYWFTNFTGDIPDTARQRDAIIRAIQEWSDYTAITWTEATGSGQDDAVDFSFGHIDGPSGTIAQSHYCPPTNPNPIAGDIMFDDDEFWSVDGGGTDLFTVALHEIGHSLGLAHSDDPSAVMFPTYSGAVTGLGSDDTSGIQSIYAPSDPWDITEDVAGGDTSLDSSIFDPSELDHFLFEGRAGDLVRIQLTGGSIFDPFDPAVALFVPAQTPQFISSQTQTDDFFRYSEDNPGFFGVWNTDPADIDVLLVQDGTYTVQVQADPDAIGLDAEGPYTLTVTRRHRNPMGQQVYLDFSGLSAADVPAEFPALSGAPDDLRDEIIAATRARVASTFRDYDLSVYTVRPHGVHSTINFAWAWPWPIGPGDDVLGSAELIDYANRDRNDDADVYWNHFAPQLSYSSATDVGEAFGTVAAHEIGHLVGIRHVDAIQPIQDLMGRLSGRNSLLNSVNFGTYDLYESTSSFFFLTFDNLWVYGKQDSPRILELTLGPGLVQEPVDVVEVIDRSGSMSGSKIYDAKEAAKLFVDAMNIGDKIGVVSYSSSASTNFSLTEVASEYTKTQAKSAINGIYASGMTSIGAGIRQADIQLDRFRSDPIRAMLVMTDGQHNTSPHPIDIINSYVDQDIIIYTIGFGYGANATLLGQIADMRNGQYYFAPSGDQLGGIYFALAGELTGQQQVLWSSGVIEQNEQLIQTAFVDPSARQARFGVSWGGSDIDLVLVAPDGTVIDHAAADAYPNISLVIGSTYEVYTIDAPLPGEWQMLAYGVDVPAGGETYNAYVTVSSAIELAMATDKSTYTTGELVHIEATLTDGLPILGASVIASIDAPTGALFDEDYVRLYDDGAHGDGAAGDGVYANDFRRLCWTGSYTITVDVDGTSNAGIPFVRTDFHSIAVSVGADSDGDGMPNVWEDREGTNRYVNDAQQDPDGDVVVNLHEYYLGTRPGSADTDDDGHSDGVERLARTNPLDPESIPDPANLAAIHGQTFEDMDANGQRDPGEPGLDGWSIELVDTSTGWVVARPTTGSQDVDGDGVIDPEMEQGLYSVLYIGSGSYQVREVQEPAWEQTFPVTSVYDLTLVEGQVVEDINFGNVPRREIYGTKWQDLNGNGVRDQGEQGLEGWAIYLDVNKNGRFDSKKDLFTTTDVNGDYAFLRLPEGTYTVAEVPQAGWIQTFPAEQGGHIVTIGYAAVVEGVDFGNVAWEAIEPLGSLVYDVSLSGTIASASDSNSLSLLIDPGQKITVVVDPDAALQPTVSLHTVDDDGDLLLASDSAGAAGEPVVLQTVATRGRLAGLGPGPAAYVLTVGGEAGTTGQYAVQIVLNAAVEDEQHGGEPNDNKDAAQDLDDSFIPLLHAVDDDEDDAHPYRGAVLGSLPTGQGDFSGSQTQYNNVHYPNTLTFSFSGAVPPTGDGILTVFAIADLNSSYEYLTLTAEGTALGNLFVTGGQQQQPVETTVDLSQARLAAWAADGIITFTVKPSSSVNNLGPNELTLELNYPTQGPSSEDHYSFTLVAGESATLVVTSLDGGGVAPPPITVETEPNDDGVSGGSISDLPFANDWSGSFVPIGGDDYRAVLTGNISAGYDGDWDFFKILASPGDSLVVAMDRISLGDPYLRLFDNTGSQIAYNDDGGPGLNSRLVYSSFSYEGDYYVVADSYSSRTGSYRLTATLTTTDFIVPGPGGQAHVELYDESGDLLEEGTDVGTNVDEAIENFVAPEDGRYYVRVFGSGDYSLVVTRNAGFDIEGNDDSGSAQEAVSREAAARRWVLGHVGDDGDAADQYAVYLRDNSTLGVETFTPAHQEGEFVNELDPMVRVYDSSGAIVASDDNSAPDGRNAKLRLRVPRGLAGVYFIEIVASDGTSIPTSGEYILGIKGAAPEPWPVAAAGGTGEYAPVATAHTGVVSTPMTSAGASEGIMARSLAVEAAATQGPDAEAYFAFGGEQDETGDAAGSQASDEASVLDEAETPSGGFLADEEPEKTIVNGVAVFATAGVPQNDDGFSDTNAVGLENELVDALAGTALDTPLG